MESTNTHLTRSAKKARKSEVLPTWLKECFSENSPGTAPKSYSFDAQKLIYVLNKRKKKGKYGFKSCYEGCMAPMIDQTFRNTIVNNAVNPFFDILENICKLQRVPYVEKGLFQPIENYETKVSIMREIANQASIIYPQLRINAFQRYARLSKEQEHGNVLDLDIAR